MGYRVIFAVTMARSLAPLKFNNVQLKRADLITAVLDQALGRPDQFQLQPKYPNPFNARTVISYQVPQRTWVQLKIYNVAGQPVRQLVQKEQLAGQYGVFWDGTDGEGQAVGSGVYLARTRRLLLLK